MATIKELEMLAEFLGSDLDSVYPDHVNFHDFKGLQKFNPHEETGRHFLVEIELKLTPSQFTSYANLMRIEHANYQMFHKKYIPWQRWFKTASAEISYKYICEVLKER